MAAAYRRTSRDEAEADAADEERAKLHGGSARRLGDECAARTVARNLLRALAAGTFAAALFLLLRTPSPSEPRVREARTAAEGGAARLGRCAWAGRRPSPGAIEVGGSDGGSSALVAGAARGRP